MVKPIGIKFRMIALLLALLLLVGCVQSTLMTWQEQYDLGVRYLSEGNYKEAILAFNAAIEIDPKEQDAYIRLAEIYTELGDEEKLSETVAAAVEQFGDSVKDILLLEKPEPENNLPEESENLVYETLGQAQYTQLAALTSTIYDAQWCSGWFGKSFDSTNLFHRFAFTYIYLRAGEDVMPYAPKFTHEGDGITHSTIYISESEMNAINEYFFGSAVSRNGETYWELSPTFSVSYEGGMYSLRAPAGDPGYPLNLTAVVGMMDNGDGTYLVSLSGYDIDDHDILRSCDPYTYFAMSPEEMAQRVELNHSRDVSAIVFLENGQFYLKSMDFSG